MKMVMMMNMKEKVCHISPMFFPFPFLVGLLLLVSVYSRCNQTRPIIFNFGDSNSDTGSFFITKGMISQLPQNVTRSLSFHFHDRLCNGRLVLDFLCESLNVYYLSPFMESVASNFINGVNFAVAGSSAYPRNSPFSLVAQVAQFARFKSRSLEFFSRGIEGLLGNEEFANALYLIDIGQNDLDIGLASQSYAELVEIMPYWILEFEYAMWVSTKPEFEYPCNISYGKKIAFFGSCTLLTLNLLGARKFWVHNTGPLGCLPIVLTKGNYSASDLDEHGCARIVNQAAQEFNGQLRRMCEKLGRHMKNATVVYVDIFAIKYDLIANSSQYGFKNPLKVCCGYGDGKYNYNSTSPCGGLNFQVCPELSEYVNWDGTHYTEAANKFVATKILSNRYSTPQIALSNLFT